jgi:hypothetical protein
MIFLLKILRIAAQTKNKIPEINVSPQEAVLESSQKSFNTITVIGRGNNPILLDT